MSRNNLLCLLWLAEKSLMFLRLLLLTNGFFTFHPKMKLVYFAVYLLAMILLVPYWQQNLRVAARSKHLWFLMGIALTSCLWSNQLALGLRRSIMLLGQTLFGVYLARRYSFKEQLHWLAWILSISALFSLVFALALPNYGLQSGGWRGIFSHRNTLGRLMCLSAIVFLILSRSAHKHRWLPWAGFVLSAFIVWRSASKTALLVLVLLIAIFFLYNALRWNYILAVPCLLLAALVGGGLALWLAENLETFLGIFGKNTTFTGRVRVWEEVWLKILDRPWLGYGYGVFWLGWGSEAEEIWIRTYWNDTLEQAHNGFLNLWLELGLLGLLTWGLGFLRQIPRAIAYFLSTKTAEGLWPLMYMTFILLYNLTETTVMARNSIFWVFYVATILSLESRTDLAAQTSVQTSHPNKSDVRTS